MELGRITRRAFCSLAPAVLAAAAGPVVVPVSLVMDSKAKLTPEVVRHFWSSLWPQAVQEFAAGGIRLECRNRTGEVLRPPGRPPVVSGLDPATLNVVLTGTIPMEWDSGRSLSGVTLRYRGRHLCMISLYRAHGHLIPLVSVNTCVHEILHALMLDIFEQNPQGVAGAGREFRIDYLATRLWLFHDGADIRRSAETYVRKLRSDAAAWATEPGY
ncbi:hypothetical protein [Paludibaculum fermentans]|uniref:Uncharacterized protein n=1 Tax=Paludibaculum fermentans TaxID=1473598 RepID=A0A7S7NVI1_PALFE|nr:hypothetical protein [Paludibaculum fermentans]QOY90556.1 hypothetical protein IRI77_11580 [Paludibaculum fermentans]